MKAKDVYNYLLDKSLEKWEHTCDGLIAGDAERDIRKVGTCFKLTAELIARAADEQIDMIITHEPTFAKGDSRNCAEPIDRKKWELLDKSGIVVYRFHDHAHNCEPDYIHAGFISALGLDIAHKHPRESLGVCRYELEHPLSVRQLCRLIEQNLGIDFIRVVGDTEALIKTLCLGLGAVGFDQINKLFDPGCDVLITGEVGEVCIAEYVRDACFFGEKKALIILGHFSSEYAGMRLLAHQLDKQLIPTEYLHSGEVYSKIHFA